jgi:hypothetical protein
MQIHGGGLKAAMMMMEDSETVFLVYREMQA